MRIAFVDDREDNRAAWTAAMCSICGSRGELRAFGSVDEFSEVVKEWKPDVVFVDFFIDGRYGTEVIQLLRAEFGSSVIIIAHSSLDAANDGMISRVNASDGSRLHGADAAIPKTKDVTPSPTLVERFSSFEQFDRFVETCRQPGRSE